MHADLGVLWFLVLFDAAQTPLVVRCCSDSSHARSEVRRILIALARLCVDAIKLYLDYNFIIIIFFPICKLKHFDLL